MTTLFSHTLSALTDNMLYNNLDHLFDGFDSVDEAIDCYYETFSNDDPFEAELIATQDALKLMFDAQSKSMGDPVAQQAIEQWNTIVWGQDFGDGEQSIPFNSRVHTTALKHAQSVKTITAPGKKCTTWRRRR